MSYGKYKRARNRHMRREMKRFLAERDPRRNQRGGGCGVFMVALVLAAVSFAAWIMTMT